MKSRKIYYDILRITAILFVIYNHTNERGYFLYAFPSTMVLKILYIAIAAVIAVGVPVFFMISGALLLDKEETIGQLYGRRVSRIVIVIMLFSLFQYVFRIYDGTGQRGARWIADNMIDETMVPSYWFLYSYLAYLIILPLLRRLAHAMRDEDFRYLIILYLAIEGLGAIILYLMGYDSYNDFFGRPMFDRIIIFPLVGYYMEHRMKTEKYSLKGVGIAAAASTAVIAVFVIMTLRRNMPYEQFTTYDKGLYTCGLTLVLDMALFYTAKYFFDVRPPAWAKNDRIRRAITTAGGAVFGIYLVEGNVRYFTISINSAISPVIGMLPAAVVWVVLVFVISFVISMILKFVPGIRKIM